jgi:hypothetical protein
MPPKRMQTFSFFIFGNLVSEVYFQFSAPSQRGLSAELTGGVASCRSGIMLKLAGPILKTCKNISRNI